MSEKARAYLFEFFDDLWAAISLMLIYSMKHLARQLFQHYNRLIEIEMSYSI